MRKVLTFGEIMLRLAPPGYLRFSQTNSFDVIYGGGESNVAGYLYPNTEKELTDAVNKFEKK